MQGAERSHHQAVWPRVRCPRMGEISGKTWAALIATGAFIVGAMGGCATGCTYEYAMLSDATPSTVTVTRTARAPQPQAPTRQQPAGPQDVIATDGTYVVGVDILPGVYRTAGPVSGGRNCYYKRLASFDSSDIIDNEGAQGPQVVEIQPSDVAFSTTNCLPWQLAS